MRQIFLYLLMVIMTTMLVGQDNLLDWEHEPNNPVLTKGSSGAWDDVKVWSPDVIFYNGKYHMWYAGDSGSAYAIGYATSDDGITWTKHSNNPVLTGSSTKWYGTHLYVPRVVLVSTVFHMYFFTWADKIGHAVSNDGISWTISADPVLEGASGSWDSATCAPAEIIHDGSIFHMWYTGVDDLGVYSVGYATSPDGITWIKYANNPVFNPGNFGFWDGAVLYATSVVSDGNGYSLWYSAKSGETGVYNQTGRATSSNGTDWLRQTVTGPEIAKGDSGTWNDAASFYASAIYQNEKYEIWYNGGSEANMVNWGIGYAWSEPVGIESQGQATPVSAILKQNYPNPFNPITHIRYSIPENTEVTLVVYDMLGREITSLVNDHRGVGTYEVLWNGRDRNGGHVPTGVYFAHLRARGHSEVIKMLLLK